MFASQSQAQQGRWEPSPERHVLPARMPHDAAYYRTYHRSPPAAQPQPRSKQQQEEQQHHHQHLHPSRAFTTGSPQAAAASASQQQQQPALRGQASTMSDAIFVKLGHRCEPLGDYALRGCRGDITCEAHKLDLFIAAGMTLGNHVHGALVLKGYTRNAFRLSWVRSAMHSDGVSFKLLIVHRLACGLCVSGCSEMREVRAILGSMADNTGSFDNFHCHKIKKLSSWHVNTLAALLNHDLTKELQYKAVGWTPAITNCIVMPALVCVGMALDDGSDEDRSGILCDIDAKLYNLGKPLMDRLTPRHPKLLDHMLAEAFATEAWTQKCHYDWDCTQECCMFAHPNGRKYDTDCRLGFYCKKEHCNLWHPQRD